MVTKLRLIRYWLVVCLVLASQHAYAQDSSVTAQLSQASIAFGDSVSLTVTARNVDKAIDLSPLERQFTILGRSSSREVRFVNGIETAISNWVVQLEPKVPGVLTVPPIPVGSFKSQPLALNVGEQPIGNDRVLFVEASVDTDSPFVQSQVLLTIKVWQAVNILEGNKVNLGSDQFLTIALERDKEYLETLDGREYLVQEQQFALFPQASGVHTFGPIELRAKIPLDNSRVRGIFTPSRNVKRLSNPVTINVKARPDSTQGQWWLPASDVQIRETWSGDPSAIDANGTITRTIEVIASGVGVDQLPEIETPTIDGLKVYADNTDRSSVATDAGIVSTQKVTWAVVPERNGDIPIPPINLNWFNTQSAQTEVATLPGQNLSVFGVVEEAAPTVATSSQSSDDNAANPNSALVNSDVIGPLNSASKPYWLWLLIGAVAFAVLQAVCYGIWRLWNRRRSSQNLPPTTQNDAESVPSLAHIRKSVNQRDLPAVQRAVLEWAAQFWPRTPPKSLLSVAKRLQEPGLEAVFGQIDAALYGSAQSEVDLSNVESQMQVAASRHIDGQRIVAQNSRLPAL